MKNPTKKKERGAGRVAFLANRDKIAALLNDGHTARTIYTQLGDSLCVSYVQFTRYVNRYIRDSSNDGKDRRKQTDNPAPPPKVDPAKPTAKEKRPFEFDSKGGHNGDDLI